MLNQLKAWLRAIRPSPATPAPTSERLTALLAPPFGPGAGWWRDDPTEQLRNYRSWVYAAVNAIGQEAARNKPYIYQNTGSAEHEHKPLEPNHPLVKLLDNPNPWLTPWELWYSTVVSLELTGNCFWYVGAQELWLIPTPWVRIRPDAKQFISAYEVAAPGTPTELFAPSEIIHLKYPNPLDPHYGLSPVQASALTVDANTELLKSRYQTFLVGPRPGVVLQTDQTLLDQTVRRLEEKLTEKLAGRTNWHRPLVLEQGLKATPWTLTPAEMDYLNSARMTRDEILGLFRVPTPILGLVENLGLGKDIWLGARTAFCEGTIQPKLELMAQALTRDLARRYGEQVVISFPDCSPRLAEERRRDDELDARLGVRTVNEIRAARGLKPLSAL